jgi:hypothetical protein
MEKQVFIEGSLKHSLITMLVFLPITLTVLSFFVQSILINLFITFALGFWYASFQEERTITCDPIECSIRIKNFWSSRVNTEYFQWSDVTETKFIFTPSSESSDEVHFEIVAEGRVIKILSPTTILSSKDENLISLVNEATSHLPYVWIKDTKIGSVWTYSKVPRI